MNTTDVSYEYKKLVKDDKEPSQYADFDSWCFGLQGELQDLYDTVFVNDIPTFEQRAKLDLIYTYIEDISKQGKELLRNR